jgi:hypothetical protein
MNHWAFVAAAYAVVAFGASAFAGLSWRAMRRAEAAADALTRR